MKGARETNYGTRIDYIFADKSIALGAFTDCVIMPDVMGSDHCPVKGTLKWTCIPANKVPPSCTRNFPEFAGIQTKLSAFFTKASKRPVAGSPNRNVEQSNKDVNDSQDGNHISLQKSSSFPPPAKKQKLEISAVKKQSSLANFFGRPPIKSKTEKEAQKSEGNKSIPVSTASIGTKEIKAVDVKVFQGQPKAASAAWKNLLKGPPPAPLCKGHREPCLLRTVKKEDSLNKGRQFYVCCKPEGHKSNPEARCDHFEWVEKKKKSINLSK